jgi:Glycosyl transferases group 1
MRAGVSLEGLSARHDVSVAVIAYEERSLAWARAHASAVAYWGLDQTRDGARSWLESTRGRAAAAAGLPDPVRLRPPIIGDRITETFPVPFDAVVVMRAWLAGVAIPFLGAELPVLLDADDDDAAAARSMAHFDRAEARAAVGYESFQRTVFPWFRQVLFASSADARAPYLHLPNAVEIPAVWRTRPGAAPVELVFVGAPGYGPNRDALRRLREEIMPAIAARGVDARLRVPAADEDVAPFYARAHIAVVPLRSGGGTRIKILEAFAHGCPVVSTPTGAHGLGVTGDEQLVVTGADDDADGFAAAIVRLAADEERRVRLAAAARCFVAEHHDRVAVGARLARLVDELSAPR